MDCELADLEICSDEEKRDSELLGDDTMSVEAFGWQPVPLN